MSNDLNNLYDFSGFITFRQTILSQSPVVYLPLDETTNNISNNIVNSNNNGVYPNSFTTLNQSSLLKSFKGKSVAFAPNSNSRVIIPYVFSTASFTAGCMLRVNSLSMISNFLQVNLIVTGQRSQFTLGVGNPNYSSAGNFLIGLSQNQAFYNTSIRLGTTANFICMTLTNSILTYYVNGVEILTTTTAGSSSNPVNENNRLLIGNFTGASSNSLNLSEVFLFDKTLSSEAINELNSNRF